MKLLIDAGNTRIKWQLREDGRILLRGAGELEADGLFQAIPATSWPGVQAVAVSTVRSEDARVQLEGAIARFTSVPVRFYWTVNRFRDLTCAYGQPARMGADRWHALVAAWDRVRAACVVVDAGSAITVDWIDDAGHHLGGYILPGRMMMIGSLRQSTARVLFDEGPGPGDTAPGTTTAECVFHGVNWLLQVLARELGRQSLPVLVTGGDGAMVKKALDEAGMASAKGVSLCPDLVFDGLALVEAEPCDG